MRDEEKPWAGEFALDNEPLDEVATEILLANMRRGRNYPCQHRSEITADGQGAFCIHCGETLE